MEATYQHGWTKSQLLNIFPEGQVFPDGWVYSNLEECWFWPLPPSRIWRVFVQFEGKPHPYERWATHIIFDQDHQLGFATLPPNQKNGQELQLFPAANEWPLELLKPDPPSPYLVN